MKTIATVASVVLTLEIVKWTLGPPTALVLAAVALALCLGIVYGAGAKAETPSERAEQ